MSFQCTTNTHVINVILINMHIFWSISFDLMLTEQFSKWVLFCPLRKYWVGWFVFSYSPYSHHEEMKFNLKNNCMESPRPTVRAEQGFEVQTCQNWHNKYSTPIFNLKLLLCPCAGNIHELCQATSRRLKPVFLQTPTNRLVYESLRCLDLPNWWFSWRQTMTTTNKTAQTNYITPYACTQGNKQVSTYTVTYYG